MNSSIKHFETGEIINGFNKFLFNFPEYADYAQELSNEAESYRDFEVASVLAAISPGDPQITTIVGTNKTFDHSHKPKNNGGLDEEELRRLDEERAEAYGITEYEDPDMPGTGDELHSEFGIPTRGGKDCAETGTLIEAERYESEYARSNGGESPYLYAIGFVIVGSTIREKIAEVFDFKKTALTLPPCAPCTTALDNSPFTSRATLYVSTGFSGGDPYQVRSIRHLKDFHARGRDYVYERPSLLSPGVGKLALELFRSRIGHTQLPEKLPSRMISSIARHALLEAGRSV